MHKYATSAKCPNIVTVCRWKQFPFALFETSPWVHLGQRSIFPKCKAFHMLDKQNHLLLFYISFHIFTYLKTHLAIIFLHFCYKIMCHISLLYIVTQCFHLLPFDSTRPTGCHMEHFGPKSEIFKIICDDEG